ncbi:hypothetical protein [Paracoccus zhouxuedongae]|uniref:hypothetical protein n=1 Tax=Paracoccus sp. p3-h83 TaxID=3342805 RepID=UPI0035BC6EE3
MTVWGLMWNERVAAALVTALVGGGVVALGWFLTHALSRRRDTALRHERVADMQRALLAEIRAHAVALERQSFEGRPEERQQMLDRLAADQHVPILPHDANDRVFRALVSDIHILPEWAIDPVVRYYRLLAVRAALAQDIRTHAKDHPQRATQMFADYLELNEETLDTAIEAIEILATSLRGGAEAIAALMARDEAQMVAAIRAHLPDELADLRRRLNTQPLDRSAP